MSINEQHSEVQIDLQAQREGESDRAYLAYKIYRDLGEARTPEIAHEVYIKKIDEVDTLAARGRKRPRPSRSKPSGAFKKWFIDYEWALRVKEWDDAKRKDVQAAQLNSDRESYLNRIETSRATLERTATMGMKFAEVSLAMSINELQRLAKEADKNAMSKEQLYRFGALTKTGKDAIEILALAKTEIYDALGLVKTLGIITNAQR